MRFLLSCQRGENSFHRAKAQSIEDAMTMAVSIGSSPVRAGALTLSVTGRLLFLLPMMEGSLHVCHRNSEYNYRRTSVEGVGFGRRALFVAQSVL